MEEKAPIDFEALDGASVPSDLEAMVLIAFKALERSMEVFTDFEASEHEALEEMERSLISKHETEGAH